MQHNHTVQPHSTCRRFLVAFRSKRIASLVPSYTSSVPRIAWPACRLIAVTVSPYTGLVPHTCIATVTIREIHCITIRYASTGQRVGHYLLATALAKAFSRSATFCL
eukprot:3283566-Rhodomonas_salina.2